MRRRTKLAEFQLLRKFVHPSTPGRPGAVTNGGQPGMLDRYEQLLAELWPSRRGMWIDADLARLFLRFTRPSNVHIPPLPEEEEEKLLARFAEQARKIVNGEEPE